MPQSIPTLQELAFMYGTDKGKDGHNYIPFYEKHLPKDPKKILEIGVKTGASISMWQKHFPTAEIHGMDLFIDNPEPNIPGVKWWKGNQCDWRILEVLRRENFDVIIDDASHNSRDQMMTFFGLFNGKHYFIEDLHCARQEFYQDGLPYRFTADQMFSSLRYPHGFMPDVVAEGNIVLIKSKP